MSEITLHLSHSFIRFLLLLFEPFFTIIHCFRFSIINRDCGYQLKATSAVSFFSSLCFCSCVWNRTNPWVQFVWLECLCVIMISPHHGGKRIHLGCCFTNLPFLPPLCSRLIRDYFPFHIRWYCYWSHCFCSFWLFQL